MEAPQLNDCGPQAGGAQEMVVPAVRQAPWAQGAPSLARPTWTSTCAGQSSTTAAVTEPSRVVSFAAPFCSAGGVTCAQAPTVKVCVASTAPSSASEYWLPSTSGAESIKATASPASAETNTVPSAATRLTFPAGAVARTTERLLGASAPAAGETSTARAGGAWTLNSKRAPLPCSFCPASSLRRGETSR